MREVSGGNYCQNDLRPNFVLGDATNVDLVRIEWPSGNVQELTDFSPNRMLTIKESVFILPTNPSSSLNGSVTLIRTPVLGGMAFQWRFEGTDLAGQTNHLLKLTNIVANQAGPYGVVVTTPNTTITNHVCLTVDPTFTKITTGPLVTELGESSGATWGDFDGDGYPDVFVSRYKTALSTFYHNNRDGSFSATAPLPFQTKPDVWWAPTLAADLDNDGKLDLFAPRQGKPSFFYFNNGDGTFTASQFESATSWNVAVADYDRDGLLDLYLSMDGRLFRNNGDRTFTRTGSVGSAAGSAWGDYDDDGWPELFTAAVLWKRDSTGSFKRAKTFGVANAIHGAWGDYNNDGFLDLCVAAFGGNSYVYRNLGKGEFELAAIGQTITGYYNSASWADYDNDGFLDLFMTYGNSGRNSLFHNNGDGTFTRIQTGSVVNEAPTGSGTDFASVSGLWFDYDNDGFLDLYVANGSGPGTAITANFLYHNNGNSNAWLKVELVGTASNHDGVGAKVRAQAKYSGQSRWQRRDISAGDALSGNQLYAHFGLGDATNVMTLRIEWPSGVVQELQNVAPKQFLTIWEPPALKAAIQEDGACELTVTAEPNRTWRIDASADLQTWQAIATVKNTTAQFGYTDSVSAAMACRFYRVVAE
jgi:enediyne biosynthesis protein E4